MKQSFAYVGILSFIKIWCQLVLNEKFEVHNFLSLPNILSVQIYRNYHKMQVVLEIFRRIRLNMYTFHMIPIKP